VRAQGGLAVIAGNARHNERWTLDPRQLNQGKRLIGTWGGDNVPERDFPRYQQLLREGRLSIAGMHDRRYSLEAINQALDDLEQGRAVRPLIELLSASESRL
jgi:S-(hydroxymethyl)glutathione dehydrogenase/alcohol dehydrogenase